MPGEATRSFKEENRKRKQLFVRYDLKIWLIIIIDKISVN